MAGFIARRLVSSFLVIVLTSMFVFALFFLGPSNPAGPVCEAQGKCTAERLEMIEEQMGLNDNVVTQYGEFAKGFFVDRTITVGSEYQCEAPCLGISYGTRTEVTDELVKKYPATLSIAVGGAAIYLTLGVTLGVLAARFRGTTTDRLLVGSSLVVSSIPYYLFALLAWIFLTLQWSIFPATGYTPLTENPAAWAAGLLLPWLVIGVTSSTQYARFTRGSMVETLGEDYIRTATAKGVKSRTVVFRHGLRAAIVPIVTIFGLDFAALLAGTIFTEQIFGINGIGWWALDSLRAPQDFPVILATVLVSAVLVVIANLIVDIVYSFLDPRVRMS
ncbi:MAG TPA: ABC transporter permease [Nocardioidaceae bacterium]|nr:ABC transporter permease [Nocardioidaceae bacterium]